MWRAWHSVLHVLHSKYAVMNFIKGQQIIIMIPLYLTALYDKCKCSLDLFDYILMAASYYDWEADWTSQDRACSSVWVNLGLNVYYTYPYNVQESQWFYIAYFLIPTWNQFIAMPLHHITCSYSREVSWEIISQ